MPGLTAALASLQDVLEIKGCAISESELWSVLCLCSEALQDILFKGNSPDDVAMPKVLVTPDTVYMRPDGKISLDTQPLDSFFTSDFCAPEWKSSDYMNGESSDCSLEKLWIFSLGMTLYKAADYNRNQHEELDISPNLHAVLSDMCEENADLRLSLTQIMQLSSSHAAVNMTESFSIHIMRMYELVFGSADNVSVDVTNPSSLSSSPQMPVLNDHLSLYEMRPAPVGKSVTNEDAPSRLSQISTKQPHPVHSVHPVHSHSGNSHSLYQHSADTPNYNFTQSIEDSLKLAKLRTHHKSAHQLIHRHSNQPMFSNGSRILHGPQRSMPALHMNYQMPAMHGPATIPVHSQDVGSSLRDPYLQHAYDRLLHRRALLTAIRHSLSNEDLVDPLMYLNQHQHQVGDMQASTNSLNYGTFRPSLYEQENYTPRELERPRSAYQLSRPKSVHQIERPKSAHPILLSDGAQDETDAVLGDPEVRRAQLSSALGDASHRSLLADINRSNVQIAQETPRTKQKPAQPQPRSRPASAKTRKSNKVKGGPEFVRLAAQPIRKLKDIMPLKSQNKVSGVTVVIELLNGKRLQLYCPSVTTGRQLFDVMLREVNLPEHYYFGLTHIMGGEHIFIQSDKKIEKYIPGLKKKALTTKKVPTHVSFTVHQRVQFYTIALPLIKHVSTRHLLYLQIRRDIVEDRLRAEEKELVSLAGVALQAEYGDYDVTKHKLNYFIINYYFPQRLLKKFNKSHQMIVNKHAANSGLSVTDAEYRFIEEAMELHEYGIHFYSVCKMKDDPLSQTWIGITSRGLALAEKKSQHRSIMQRCSWNNIAKLSFNKEKFTIKPYNHSDDPTKIQRYTDSYKKSKYLVWLAEEHHSFLVQTMAKGGDPGVLAEEEVEEYEGDEYSDDAYDVDVYDAEPSKKNVTIQEFGETSSYQFHQGEIEESEPADGAVEYDVEMSGRRAQARRTNSRRHEIEDPILDAPDHGLSPPDIEETLSDSLHARFDEVPSDSPEKRFTVVKLQRDPVSGIGIKLAGGSGGVFIASIVAGGSADREGTVRIGDRIVAINGASTEVITLSNAMELIRKANTHVELIVSQPIATSVPPPQESSVSSPSHQKGNNHRQLSPHHSEYNSISDYDTSEVEEEPPPRAKTPNHSEKTREVLRAELEAEAAALKAEPQDSSDMMLQYQQQLAKYHPKQRAQVQPSIQLPTPPQPDSISPRSPISPPVPSQLRQQLDEMSSEDLSTPVNVQQNLQSPVTTNIDDISSDELDDDVDEAAVLQHTQAPVSGTIQKPPTDSMTSSDVESSSYSGGNNRLSAFASVSQSQVPNSKSTPKKVFRLDSTSPSESSTLSEHESETDKKSSLQVAVANQINAQRTASTNQISGSKKVHTYPSTGKGDASAFHKYDSEVTSEDEEISVMMTGKSQSGRERGPSSHSSSPSSLTLRGGSAVSSSTEVESHDMKLKTPIDDQLTVGDNYKLTLHKINNSLGLNVTGGVNTSVKHGGIYVKSLVPKGAADNSARIRVGDRVISVNSMHLTSVTHKQAVETLRNATTPVRLVMERGESPHKPVSAVSSAELATPTREDDRGSSVTPVPTPDKTPEPRAISNKTPDIERLSVITQSPRYELELTKGSSGLGFSVLGGRDPSSPDPRLSLVRVKKIFPLGAAAKSKKLLIGDVILRVNDKSVEGLSHSETVSLLRTAPSLVKLYICRPDARILTPLPESVLSNTLRAASASSISQSPAGIATGSTPNQSGITKVNQSVTHENNFSEPSTRDDKISQLASSRDDRASQSALSDNRIHQSAFHELNDTRSTISANSSTTIGTQESSTSRDTVQTILKSPAVQEFEASLRSKRGTDYSLPTPIRELDDMLLANTSTHTSRSHSPQSLSRGSSLNRSQTRMMSEADIAVVNDKLANLDVSQELGSYETDEKDNSDTSSETGSTSSSTDSTPSSPDPLVSDLPVNIPADYSNERATTQATQHIITTLPDSQSLRSGSGNISTEEDEAQPTESVITSSQSINPDSINNEPIKSEDLNNKPIKSDISRNTSPSSESSSNTISTDRIVTVTLEKDSFGSLGFSVAGAASLGGCYIKKVIKDPALVDGRLRAGDRLLEVNGHVITKLTNPAAVMLIKNQPSSVTITVLRPLDSPDGAPSKPSRTEASSSVSGSVAPISTEVKQSVEATVTGYDNKTDMVLGESAQPPPFSETDQEPRIHNSSVSDRIPDQTPSPVADELVDQITEQDVNQLKSQILEHMEDQEADNSSEPVMKDEVANESDSLPYAAGVQSESQLVSSSPVIPEVEAPADSKQEVEDDVGEQGDDFSSVEGDVPEDIDDSWSSDSEEEEDDIQSKELLLESHIGTLSLGSDLNSTLDKTLDEELLADSRIGTPSQESSAAEETLDEENVEEEATPDVRLRKDSLSPWADSTVGSDDGIPRPLNSLTPIDLTRNESGRSMGFGTDGGNSSSPIGGLSRNASTHLSRNDSANTNLSRHDSTNSHQSFLSTPILSRNTSLKLPPTEEMYQVSLVKPAADASLGIHILGIVAGGNVFACVKGLQRGGIAHADGKIKVGHKILQINGEDIEGANEGEIQARCVNILRQCEGQVDLVMSRDITDSYSDDLALTHDEDDLIGNSDDQLGALSDASYDKRFLGRSAPRRIFGPSVTTTDEDTDGDGGDDFSQVIEHLSNDLHGREYADSQISADESVTDDSSVDFDLPDESHFLETSIRLTRNDMKSPQSDDTRENSGSDTDHVVSEDDIMPNSTKYNTDEPHAEDTDTEGSMKDFDSTGDWGTSTRGSGTKYDSSGIPGATADPYIDEDDGMVLGESSSRYRYLPKPTPQNQFPQDRRSDKRKPQTDVDGKQRSTKSFPWAAMLGKQGIDKRVENFQKVSSERNSDLADELMGSRFQNIRPYAEEQNQRSTYSDERATGQTMYEIGKMLADSVDNHSPGEDLGPRSDPRGRPKPPDPLIGHVEHSDDELRGKGAPGIKQKQIVTTVSLSQSAKAPSKPVVGTDSESKEQGAFSKDITMSWINSLKLVTTPARSLYTDSSLEGVIMQLLTKIANDDVYEEFRQLKSLKLVDNCEAGKLKGNKTKNRFRNVLPYDSTRVRLNSVEDYINASHVKKTLGKDTYNYIASQGPTPQTTADFWQMVIEQGVTVIVMATQDVEGGKVKCHRYWPDSPHMPMTVTGAMGGYEVRLAKLFVLRDFDIRHLEVKEVNTGRVHKVIHMNYTRWPDHVMPESAAPLLQFIRVMHELYNDSEIEETSGGRGRGRPILVHCSAGIGRTGTLITLDIVLASIERDLKFNIHQIVTDLRTQRPGMIQTKDQYLFCYTATLEALETLKKCLPSTADTSVTTIDQSPIDPVAQSAFDQSPIDQSAVDQSAVDQSSANQ